MKSYEELNIDIKKELESIVKKKQFKLSAKGLFNYISCSVGEDKRLAEIFAVPIELVRVIRE